MKNTVWSFWGIYVKQFVVIGSGRQFTDLLLGNVPSHSILIVTEFFDQKQNKNHPSAPLLARFGSMWLCPVSKTQISASENASIEPIK